MTYQIQNDLKGNPCAVCKTNADGSGMSIPFDPDNTDYANFKKEILDGAELLDADGQVMDAIQFAKELP